MRPLAEAVPGFVPIIHASLADRPDEADTVIAAEAIRNALVSLGHESEILALDLDFSILAGLAERDPDALVFNLVEAVRGDATLAHMAPALLEHFGLAFTGSGLVAHLRTMSKIVTKQSLRASGLPTPAWWVAGEAVPAKERVIIKSVREHASYGLDIGSVVGGDRAAAEMAARESRFGGEFFAERFLDGREFNAAILAGPDGPELLPLQEIRFDELEAGRPRIVDYEAKWDETSAAYHHTPRCFGVEAREPELAAEIARLSLECWREFDLAGYGRVDFRTDDNGTPFILEVNINPCLTPDAGLFATAAEAGLSYADIIARIVADAGQRIRRP